MGGSFQIWGGEGRNHSWNISGGEGIVSLHGYRSSATVTALSEGTATITVTHQYKTGGLISGTTVTDTYQYVVTVSAPKVTRCV